MIKWNDGSRNGTGLLDWLDEKNTIAAIDALEHAAGVKGEWDGGDEDCLPSWWGLHGTFNGHVFTVYTHKSGCIKIGGFGDGLDVIGLKAALTDIVNRRAA